MSHLEALLRLAETIDVEPGAGLPKVTTPDGWTLEWIRPRPSGGLVGGDPSIKITGTFVPSMPQAFKAAEDAERQAKIDEISRDLAKHPSARRMTAEAVDEAIAAEVAGYAQMERVARLQRMTETLEQVTAERDKALAERDVLLEESDRLIAEFVEADSRVRAVEARERRSESGLTDRVQRRVIERLQEERDRARASAIEWANTPIHRLLTAYNERQVRGMAQPGSLRYLNVEHGSESWTVSWQRAVVPGWEVTIKQGDTLDEACTAAAEQIEAT